MENILRKTMWTSKFLLRSSFRQSDFRRLLLSIRRYSISADDPDAEWDRMYQRGVPRTMEEMSSMLRETVNSPPDAKLLKVAIVGVPNSGKSTLTNSLMDWRVCSVSSKVHTTTANARAVLNQGSTQVVFLDTPGLVTPLEVSKHSLQRSMMSEAEMSMQTADLMCVIHDMSNRYTYSQLQPTVLRLLALYPNIPSVLVLNKIDILKSKKHLLDATRLLTDGVVGGSRIEYTVEKTEKLDREKFIEKALRDEKNYLKEASQKLDKEKLIEKALRDEKNDLKETSNKAPVDKRIDEVLNILKNARNKAPLDKSADKVLNSNSQMSDQEVLDLLKDQRGWPNFQDVFFLSALQGSGVDDLRDYLFSKAYKSSWMFSSNVVTDQNPQEIILMTVREKFLENFQNEIPYKVKFDVEHLDLSDSEMLYVFVRVRCRRKGLQRFIVGPNGRHIIEIAKAAEQELRNTFQTEVRLRIEVKFDASLDK